MHKLQIDYREKAFIQTLQKKLCIENVTELETKGFTTKSLNVGDFIITNQEDQPILFIERKTKNDLISSIIDGRFRDQRSRLQETGCDIVYIIELHGNSSRGITPQLQNVYVSCILNLILKHKIKVFLVKDISETTDLIITLLKKYNNGDFDVGDKKKTETHPIKIKSKGDNLKANLFAHQLTLINGVSLPIANKISDIYKTPMGLINAYTLLTDTKEKCVLLKDIQITEKRKVGPAISKRIYESMCGCEQVEQKEEVNVN